MRRSTRRRVNERSSKPSYVSLPKSNIYLLDSYVNRSGNRVVKVQLGGHNPFTIQTNGNLPRAHDRLRSQDIHDLNEQDLIAIEKEIHDYLTKYDTMRGAMVRMYETKVKPSIGYTPQEMWDIYIERIRGGDIDSALHWYDLLVDAGVHIHALDTALATGARVAPKKVPMARR